MYGEILSHFVQNFLLRFYQISFYILLEFFLILESVEYPNYCNLAKKRPSTCSISFLQIGDI